MDSILIPAASPTAASARHSVFHTRTSDAWRAARADRLVTPGMPSASDATAADFNSINSESVVATTFVVRGASAELVSAAGRLADGAAKQAAPPRGRFR